MANTNAFKRITADGRRRIYPYTHGIFSFTAKNHLTTHAFCSWLEPLYQFHQAKQVIKTEYGPSIGNHNKRIGRQCVRPTGRKLLKVSRLVVVVNTVLTPRVTIRHQLECASR